MQHAAPRGGRGVRDTPQPRLLALESPRRALRERRRPSGAGHGRPPSISLVRDRAPSRAHRSLRLAPRCGRGRHFDGGRSGGSLGRSFGLEHGTGELLFGSDMARVSRSGADRPGAPGRSARDLGRAGAGRSPAGGRAARRSPAARASPPSTNRGPGLGTQRRACRSLACGRPRRHRRPRRGSGDLRRRVFSLFRDRGRERGDAGGRVAGCVGWRR